MPKKAGQSLTPRGKPGLALRPQPAPAQVGPCFAPYLHLSSWLGQAGHAPLYYFVLGSLPTLALHLAYDCFPKAWQGAARISLAPLPWRLPGWLSFLYLAMSMLLALLAVALLLQTGWVLGLVLLVGWLCGQKLIKKEKQGLPVLLYLASLALVLFVRYVFFI